MSTVRLQYCVPCCVSRDTAEIQTFFWRGNCRYPTKLAMKTFDIPEFHRSYESYIWFITHGL